MMVAISEAVCYNNEHKKTGGLSMKLIENQTLDQERALYGVQDVTLRNIRFDGPADGESALKECSDVVAENTFFNLRYPCWHDHYLTIRDSELTEACRASLWYCDHVEITGTKLHGIKALRECRDVLITDSDVESAEFGWSVDNLTVRNCTAKGEYFMLHCRNLDFSGVRLKGKYSFQYLENAVFDNCDFDTKDCLWHSRNVTVKNSTIKGEYLAWYADHLTLINCTIIGTQPLCYCTNLKLIDCKMIDTDLSFERSEVEANLLCPIDSVKNPLRGKITAPEIGEIIFDIPEAHGEVVVTG